MAKPPSEETALDVNPHLLYLQQADKTTYGQHLILEQNTRAKPLEFSNSLTKQWHVCAYIT